MAPNPGFSHDRDRDRASNHDVDPDQCSNLDMDPAPVQKDRIEGSLTHNTDLNIALNFS